MATPRKPAAAGREDLAPVVAALTRLVFRLADRAALGPGDWQAVLVNQLRCTPGDAEVLLGYLAAHPPPP